MYTFLLLLMALPQLTRFILAFAADNLALLYETIPPIYFTEALIGILLGAVTSLLFSYVPGLRVWFAKQAEDFKKLFLLGVMVVITAAIFAFGCLDWLPVQAFTCTRAGAFDFIYTMFLAALANTETYKRSPQIEEVAKIKAVQNAERLQRLKK